MCYYPFQIKCSSVSLLKSEQEGVLPHSGVEVRAIVQTLPSSPTALCEMWHSHGCSFKACLFCLCALHCVCVHFPCVCVCVCVRVCVWVPLCLQGGGQASIFTRASAAAVHWHATGSVTVVIQGCRSEVRRLIQEGLLSPSPARPGPAAPPWRTSTSTTPMRRKLWRTAIPRRLI